MKIIKKKTKHLIAGDILIIDFLEILDKNTPLGVSGDLKYILKKFEGESYIFLYEIDKVIKENGRWQFTHYNDINNVLGIFEDIIYFLFFEGSAKYLWDVIENPFHTLPHYGKREKLMENFLKDRTYLNEK